MKRILLIILFFLPLSLFAEKVTEPEAKKVAIRFLQQQMKSRSGNVSLQLVYDGADLQSRTSQNDERPFYIYNNVAGNGFVIVSGDNLTQSILGFSTKGRFIMKDMSENVKGWLHTMSEQIEWARKHKLVRSKAIIQSWQKETRAPIEPIVSYTTAQWGQSFPFNKQLPMIDGLPAVTGCVMTATAILMKYHSWPAKGKGTIPGYSYTEKGKQYSMPERVLGEPYQWDLMPLVYEEGTSEEAENQVARLMLDLGTMLQASYASDGTGAYTDWIPDKLTTYMDYDDKGFETYSERYTEDRWIEKVKTELQANGPMIYGGAKAGVGGHAFILDGYANNDFFHVNWGWQGNDNGYYVLFAADPEDKNLSLFPLAQDACFGVIPQGQTNNNPMDEFYITKIQCNSKYIQVGKPFQIEATIGRVSNYSDNNFEASVWLTDEKGNLKEQLSENIFVAGMQKPTENRYEEENLYNVFCLCEKGFNSGDHIRIYCKSKKSSNWELAANGKDEIWDLTIANAEGKLLAVEGQLTLDYNRLSEVITIGYPEGTTVKVKLNGIDVTPKCEITSTKCILRSPSDYKKHFQIEFIQGEARKFISFYVNI